MWAGKGYNQVDQWGWHESSLLNMCNCFGNFYVVSDIGLLRAGLRVCLALLLIRAFTNFRKISVFITKVDFW